jgi:hypothetical protein
MLTGWKSGVLYDGFPTTMTSDGELPLWSILTIFFHDQVVDIVFVTPLQLGHEIIKQLFQLVKLMKSPSHQMEAF